MSVLNTITQCGFCAYYNNAMLPNCTLCGDMLSSSNSMSISFLINFEQNLAPAYCTCGRQLLANGRSCTYCNALWSSSPVGSMRRTWHSRDGRQRPPRFQVALDEYTDILHLLETLSLPSEQQPHVQTPLSADARDKYFRTVTQFDPGMCPICLEELGQPHNPAVVQLPCCNKAFHASCLNLWFGNKCTCPMCRHDLNQRARDDAEAEETV